MLTPHNVYWLSIALTTPDGALGVAYHIKPQMMKACPVDTSIRDFIGGSPMILPCMRGDVEGEMIINAEQEQGAVNVLASLAYEAFIRQQKMVGEPLRQIRGNVVILTDISVH